MTGQSDALEIGDEMVRALEPLVQAARAAVGGDADAHGTNLS